MNKGCIILAAMTAAAVTVLLPACKKEERVRNAFILQMPGNGHHSKTYLDTVGKDTYWESGDYIYINGAETHIPVVLPENELAYAQPDGTVEREGGRFYACYPGLATDVGYTSATHTYTFTMPATLAAGSVAGIPAAARLKAPLVGIDQGRSGSNVMIQFYNTCALLRIKDVENGNIVFTDFSGKLSGPFSVACTGGTWATMLTYAGNSAADAQLTVTNTAAVNELFVPIPAGSHQLEVVNGLNTRKMAGAKDFVAGRIYTIEMVTNVDIGGDVRWTTEYASSGDSIYCSWGESTWKKNYNSGQYHGPQVAADSTLPLEYDIIHQKLGGDWRLPTKAEWQYLVDSCTWTWGTDTAGNHGYLITKDGSSFFLRAMGHIPQNGKLTNVDSELYYWSSTAGSSGKAWVLHATSSKKEVIEQNCFYGMAVFGVCPKAVPSSGN